VDAIKRSQQALHQRQELASLENAFQEEQFSQLKTAYLQRVRWPALVILGLILFHLLLSYLVFPRFSKGEGLFMSRRLLRYALVFVGVCVVATSLFDDLSMVAATLGIVSAALVIALQDVCTSVAGWAVIMLGGKLGIGDRIEVDGTRGDVLDIQLLRTTMLEINGWLGLDQPTGRVIVIPNNFIFKNKVFNFSHGHPYIWGKVDLTVTFATPVASAMLLFQRVLEEETKEQFADARRAAAKMQRRYGVADADYVPIIYTQIADSGVTLSLFFVSHYRDFPATRNRLNRRLVAELERHHHIQLAYTTLSVLASSPGAVGPSAVLGADYTTPPFPPPKQG
jgi:small-conductance mechanosensitive channel